MALDALAHDIDTMRVWCVFCPDGMLKWGVTGMTHHTTR